MSRLLWKCITSSMTPTIIWNDHSACYTLLNSLDISFKKYVEDHLPNNFCFLIIWIQVIKALQSDSLECFKTMKCKLENLKLQQYPGQNITNMLLDITYCCQSLTMDGIWDHQLCLSILSTFLLANGDEMYHHSLITMKDTLEDKLKKVRFMEHATGMTHLCSKGLTYADICDLAKTRYQESKGVGKWPPAAQGLQGPTFILYPSASKRASPTLTHETRAMTPATFVVKRGIG